MMSLNPVQVLRGGAEEEKAETARLSSFVGAIAIGDLIKSTLGPKGMDKILVSIGRNEGSIEVTNDGATILKSISVDNPAAKLLQDISKVQDNEVGDGTTSVTVLAAELLKEAETLVNMKIHPQTIIAGWRRAVAAARSALTEAAQNHSSDAARFKDDLLKIAGTTLGSKILSQYKGQFALLAVDAVLRLKGSTNLRSIQLIKKAGGTLSDSYLEEGFLLDKSPGLNQPRRVEKAKILIANTPMDTDKIKIFGSRVQVDSVAKVMIGEDTLLRFSGVPLGEACSIVIRGATQQILDEAERSLHDALCVLSQTVKEPRVVYGGGCSEMLMAQAVYAAAATTPGKEAVAMEAFARALIQLPTIIADNGGFDSAQLMSELRAAHTQGQKSMGLDMVHGKIGDMAQLGIVESFQVKQQILISASEAAEQIVRVDDILKAAPRQRSEDQGIFDKYRGLDDDGLKAAHYQQRLAHETATQDKGLDDDWLKAAWHRRRRLKMKRHGERKVSVAQADPPSLLQLSVLLDRAGARGSDAFASSPYPCCERRIPQKTRKPFSIFRWLWTKPSLIQKKLHLSKKKMMEIQKKPFHYQVLPVASTPPGLSWLLEGEAPKCLRNSTFLSINNFINTIPDIYADDYSHELQSTLNKQAKGKNKCQLCRFKVLRERCGRHCDKEKYKSLLHRRARFFHMDGDCDPDWLQAVVAFLPSLEKLQVFSISSKLEKHLVKKQERSRGRRIFQNLVKKFYNTNPNASDNEKPKILPVLAQGLRQAYYLRSLRLPYLTDPLLWDIFTELPHLQELAFGIQGSSFLKQGLAKLKHLKLLYLDIKVMESSLNQKYIFKTLLAILTQFSSLEYLNFSLKEHSFELEKFFTFLSNAGMSQTHFSLRHLGPDIDWDMAKPEVLGQLARFFPKLCSLSLQVDQQARLSEYGHPLKGLRNLEVLCVGCDTGNIHSESRAVTDSVCIGNSIEELVSPPVGERLHSLVIEECGETQRMIRGTHYCLDPRFLDNCHNLVHLTLKTSFKSEWIPACQSLSTDPKLPHLKSFELWGGIPNNILVYLMKQAPNVNEVKISCELCRMEALHEEQSFPQSAMLNDATVKAITSDPSPSWRALKSIEVAHDALTVKSILQILPEKCLELQKIRLPDRHWLTAAPVLGQAMLIVQNNVSRKINCQLGPSPTLLFGALGLTMVEDL
ncbi:unnamed protein product [Cyprideis torosa]|uniref:CCT-beta n=1 Tax=Cyprideis torosa TaxID=163714 RepID=A0A7R8WIU5_9CRUS|nr:unnamed protein product [Cyprideis torosa]CAG0895075.1 unnamed protein product [Cyprideis torosa]